MRFRTITSLVVLLLLIAGLSSAQTFRGAIQGNVTDSQGAALAGAKVTATNTGTGLTREAVTDSSGNYLVSELPLGNYTVTATKEGFSKKVVTGIGVGVAAREHVDIALSPGQVKEVVEVHEEQPLIETTVDTLGGTLEAPQVEQLPINGRDYTKLLVMVPGATADPAGVSESPGSFAYLSVNGNRGRSNNFMLDGTDANDGYRNDPIINEGGVFGVPATLLPVDAVAEFAVLSSTEPEYGRNSGSVVNIVTKSGTNTLHGTLFEYFRNNHLDARNYFNTTDQPQDIFLNNQFGGSLGGRIIKDKTFFFFAYEGQREKVGSPSIITVPTQAQITQALANAGLGAPNPVIAGILARNPWTSGNPLPATDTSPGCTSVADNSEGAGFPNSCQMQASVAGLNRLDSMIAKIDQHIGKNDLLTGRYFFGDSHQSFPLTLVFGSNVPHFNTVVPTRVQVLSLSYTHVVSSKFLIEARGGWNRFAEGFAPEDVSFDPNSIGLATVPSSDPSLFGLPRISVGGFNSVGASGSVPRSRVDTNWQYFTNVSYTTGKHAFKTGMEYRRTAINGIVNSGYRGSLSFDTLENFVAGNLDGGGSSTGDAHRHTYQNNFGVYFQDNYRATRKLTLNYGLRWDHFGVITEKNNLFSIYDAASDSLVQVGSPGLPSLYPVDNKDFSPRVSLAYDLFGNGKTVVRAGWGLYYDSFSQDFFLQQSFYDAGNFGPAYNPIPAAPVSALCLAGATLASNVPVYGSCPASAQPVFTVDQNTRTPYVENYNLNVQQALGKNASLQLGYVGSQGHRLFRFRDINQTDPLGNTLTTSFGVINQLETTAFSNYNSLQALFKVQNWHGLMSTVNYTWSHAIDNASDGFDFVPQATQPDNSLGSGPLREKGNSNFDVRHRFSWLLNYQLPGSSWAPKLTKGWAVDTVVTLMTGTPFDPTYYFEGDFNGNGEFFGRMDLVGDPFAGTSTPGNYLNLSAFAVPCTWDPIAQDCVPGTKHFANTGRNMFYGPPFRNWDFSLSKDTPITERLKMQFRADFFNILNHPNFSNPVLPCYCIDLLNGSMPDANGHATGSFPITATPDVGSANPFLGGGGPRNIQLAVKFSF